MFKIIIINILHIFLNIGAKHKYWQRRVTKIKSSSNIIIFDLSCDKVIHFGDILFYIPVILFLIKNSNYEYKIICNQKSKSFLELFVSEKMLKLLEDVTNIEYAKLISNQYGIYFSHYLFRCNLYGIGGFKYRLSKKYPVELGCIIIEILGLSDSLKNEFAYKYENILDNMKMKILKLRSANIISGSDENKCTYIVSPYINSGKFRKLFINFGKFKSVIDAYTALNMRGCVVGGLSDKSDIFEYDNIEHKYYSEINEAIKFILDNDVKIGVGFDNVWMHIFDILEIPYIVLFRGKYGLINNYNHIESINVSFLRKNKKRYYL